MTEALLHMAPFVWHILVKSYSVFVLLFASTAFILTRDFDTRN